MSSAVSAMMILSFAVVGSDEKSGQSVIVEPLRLSSSVLSVDGENVWPSVLTFAKIESKLLKLSFSGTCQSVVPSSGVFKSWFSVGMVTAKLGVHLIVSAGFFLKSEVD